jgi:membrane protein DedA with SNARE-associated domain
MQNHIKETFGTVWAMLGFNTGVLATVQLTDIEVVLKIVLLLVTIVSTIIITYKKLKKE